MKNQHFKTDTFYLLDGQTCNEMLAVLTDMKKLAAVYLSDIEEMELDSDRYQEAMEIFEFVIQRFLRIEKFDSLELGKRKPSFTFNELLKSAGVKLPAKR